MSVGTRHSSYLALALGAVLSMVACGALAQEQPQPAPEAASEIEALEKALQPYVMPESGPFRPDQIAIANKAAIADWARSAHAEASSEAFTHWNEEGEIPGVCSTCHSGAGFRALYGLDGGAAGVPDHPMPIGGVVDCDTCHNPRLSTVTEIMMPSGLMHPVTPGEASCMTCHQGRSAGATVSKAVGSMAADKPSGDLSFINPHYAVAASTWLGGYGASGFQYPGKQYSGRFFHARPLASCVSCHEPHTLQVSEQTCSTCHEAASFDEIRLSRVSYDGSGDVTKGIRTDVKANADRLMQLLVEYASKVAGTPMVYNGDRHPYFFADANGDGRADEAEGGPTPYNAWTPRLLKAAYNWKFVTADPGAFVHNPHYALELLYDSIEDISAPLGHDISAWNLQR